MLDYSCERHKLSPSASINFISQRRGLAIGNGLVFYLMHFVPFVGWVLAPSYALVAATISLYHQNIDTMKTRSTLYLIPSYLDEEGMEAIPAYILKVRFRRPKFFL